MTPFIRAGIPPLLRHTPMNRNRRIVEVAQGLLDAADLLGGEP